MPKLPTQLSSHLAAMGLTIAQAARKIGGDSLPAHQCPRYKAAHKRLTKCTSNTPPTSLALLEADLEALGLQLTITTKENQVMQSTTVFGRQKESWEMHPDAFCDRGQIDKSSQQGRAIYALSDDEFAELVSTCDPQEDNLIHVDSDGFSVNHGDVGTHGIRYDFRR